MSDSNHFRVDASLYGYPEVIELQRIEDLGTLIRVAREQREATVLARHYTKVFGFEVSDAVVRAAAVIAACWVREPRFGLEDVVRMSRTQGPLLLELLRLCCEANGWNDEETDGATHPSRDSL